jgi:hypothetical protein
MDDCYNTGPYCRDCGGDDLTCRECRDNVWRKALEEEATFFRSIIGDYDNPKDREEAIIQLESEESYHQLAGWIACVDNILKKMK